jgi:hypothetical protein
MKVLVFDEIILFALGAERQLFWLEAIKTPKYSRVGHVITVSKFIFV